MSTCVRCHHEIHPSQACVPIFRAEDIDGHAGPMAWQHYLTCCTDCGALGDWHTEPKPHEHNKGCRRYVPPTPCRAAVEGFGDLPLSCTRPQGHSERHRAKARFAGPTDITVSWPREG